ncbi:hypothetical protein [Aequorivita sediminis]|uniref:hypothetical protein n=1 Tax=Aequorivita sediminis TaxID=3073653 RepID=UPI0028B1912B|nr:hypothetical protein [Aequorivita sp. F6058]
MKNIKTIIAFLFTTVLLVSCETYEDYDSEATVVGFTKNSSNINRVPEGGTKEGTVTLYVSDVSNADRTFTLVDLPADEFPTATDNYEYPSSVTIPAGVREIEVTVTAIDNSISPDDRTFFILAVQAGEGYVAGGQVLIGLKN